MSESRSERDIVCCRLALAAIAVDLLMGPSAESALPRAMAAFEARVPLASEASLSALRELLSAELCRPVSSQLELSRDARLSLVLGLLSRVEREELAGASPSAARRPRRRP